MTDHFLSRLAFVLILHPIDGWVTCDNASNNLTMLRHFAVFARLLDKHPSRKDLPPWNANDNHIGYVLSFRG
jgi:hypothetical protein